MFYLLMLEKEVWADFFERHPGHEERGRQIFKSMPLLLDEFIRFQDGGFAAHPVTLKPDGQ